MELICTEEYHDIRFSLTVGESTDKVSFLTDEEVEGLINDYPQKFRVVSPKKELVVESKEAKLKVTKK